MESVDVAIVGAGATGLAAARSLQRLGRSCVVLEARDRIGGRAWTEDVGGIRIDRGAQWLHSADRNPLVAVAAQAGATTRPSSYASAVIFDNGRRGDQSVYRRYAEATEGLVRRAIGAAVFQRKASLAQIAGRDDWGQRAAGLIASLEMGADPQDVSVADLIRTHRGGDLSVAGGLGALVASFGHDAPVRLSSPVERIDWRAGAPVTISGPFGQLQARAILITASTGVLASDGIAFDPPLPPWKRDAVADLPMGLLTKIALVPNRPLSGLPEFCVDLATMMAGQLHVMHVEPDGRMATVLTGGAFARSLVAEGPDRAAAFGRSILGAIAGAGAALDCAVSVSDWHADPYTLGAYAIVRPGSRRARVDYGRPIEDVLFFAGEACDTRQPGTVGGAVLAGTAAAKQIEAALERD